MAALPLALDPNAELIRKCGEFYDDPLGFVMWAYPWATDPAIQKVEMPLPWAARYHSFYGPDRWACEFLEDLGRQVKAHEFHPGGPAVDPIRMARVSGHGIGKGVMAAWLCDWIMSTRPKSRGTVTANTANQLATKTWPEIMKWTRRCITGHWFHLSTGKGAMAMRHKKDPNDWFCTAQTCDVENSEAFAGQHAATATSFYIFDESGGIDDVIDQVSEGGLMTGEPMKFAFGNGTQNEGWFYRIFNTDTGRKRWRSAHVDSREVQITNKKLIAEMIEDYHGEDNDQIKVRVRGMFPAMSALQFISITDLDAAFGRTMVPSQYDFAPKILTLDNAWEGDDDGVIGLVQGLSYQILRVFSKNDNDVEVAGMLANLEDLHDVDAVHIDAGYGTGVASCGRTWGRDWKLVWFAAQSPDPGYLNMRAWMYKGARDFMKGGGAIPRDQRLYNDAVQVHTVPRMDGIIQIESKKDLKARDQPSPGRLDALGLAFAYPVVKKVRGLQKAVGALKAGKRVDHNPYENIGKS